MLFEAPGDWMLYLSCILQNTIQLAAALRATQLHSLNQARPCNLYKRNTKQKKHEGDTFTAEVVVYIHIVIGHIYIYICH